jgi:hypothetical protein
MAEPPAPFVFPVEAGHVMTFARAIGDEESAAAHAAAAQGSAVSLTPPPTFVQCSAHYSPDYHLRPRPDRPWLGSGRETSGDRAYAETRDGSMHAEQTFEFHRPVRTGEVLDVRHREGRSWEKASKTGRTLHFSEGIVEYLAADGEVVVTSSTVVVRVRGEVQ